MFCGFRLMVAHFFEQVRDDDDEDDDDTGALTRMRDISVVVIRIDSRRVHVVVERLGSPFVCVPAAPFVVKSEERKSFY